ncbi:MAG: DUF5668 domain-containing protein [Ignavibacteria bacterium]
MKQEITHNRTSRHIVIGSVVIIAGFLLLFSNLGWIGFDLHRIIFSWQMILIGIGCLKFINSQDRSGLILIVIGSIFLLPKFVDFDVSTFWPAILIIIGLSILFNNRKNQHHSNNEKREAKTGSRGQTLTEDWLDDIAIFGGGRRNIHSQNFQGGKITNIFSSSEINFSGCKLAPGDNIIDIVTIFGNTSLYVPNDWKVILNVTPIFGGFSDSRRKDPNQIYNEEDGTLIIKGTLLFGEGEIKNL